MAVFFLSTFSSISTAQNGNKTLPLQNDLPLLNEKNPNLLPLNAGIAPELCCWFVTGVEDFQNDDYKLWLDSMARRGSFELLTTSPRQPPEIVDPMFHDWIKRANDYAFDRYGVRLVFDLDIRLARQAFAKQYPNAQQERLIFLEIPIPPQGTLELPFQVTELNDHYTGGMTPYLVLGNRFLKSWTYSKNDHGEIVPTSLQEVTQKTTVKSEQNEHVILHWSGKSPQSSGFFCGAVAFRYLYPDVFSSETAEFQKTILRQYRDVPLAGACQDEWGFLPSNWDGNPAKNEYWYSDRMADEYAKRYSGSSLLDDCFLMFRGRAGEENRRREKIDAFNRLCLDRHAWYASEFHRTVKEVFGLNALSATHPTWCPWPDQREFKKNGLVWWKTPRDYAQTDECTPYYCRTSLAKGTNSVWYNMYYAPLESIDEYVGEHWGGLLAGGRVNVHPVYPRPSGVKSDQSLTQVLDHGMEAARHRIRLLDFITHAPLDSPIAVVFGHFGAMNWGRPEFDKVGSTAIQCCNCLAEAGYPADLTPSSQAESGLWTLDSEGFLKYGVQKYALVVFFGESESDHADFEKLRKLCSQGGKTKIIDMAATIDRESLQKTSEDLVRFLRERGIQPQSPWKIAFPWGGKDFPTARPPLTGMGRYIDGTHVWVAAEKNPAGDEIVLTKTPMSEKSGAPTVSVSATGLFACRFDADGKLTALAASELKRFEGGGIVLNPVYPVDVALQKNADGSWSGVLQATSNGLPSGLDVLPNVQWKFLAIPTNPSDITPPRTY